MSRQTAISENARFESRMIRISSTEGVSSNRSPLRCGVSMRTFTICSGCEYGTARSIAASMTLTSAVDHADAERQREDRD